MGKVAKTFYGADLDISYDEFVSWPFTHHLIDEGISVGTNVTHTDTTRSAFTNPVGTPGEVLDLTFVYAAYFSSESIIDGAIEGQIIARLYSAWVSSSYTMYLTSVKITLFKYKADGTTDDIISETTIWSGSESLQGDSTQKTKDIPIFFSFNVEDIMSTDARLALRVHMYGYLNSSASNMYYQLLCGPSEKDMWISLPVVEEQ